MQVKVRISFYIIHIIHPVHFNFIFEVRHMYNLITIFVHCHRSKCTNSVIKLYMCRTLNISLFSNYNDSLFVILLLLAAYFHAFVLHIYFIMSNTSLFNV
jgi:hypothetical protein